MDGATLYCRNIGRVNESRASVDRLPTAKLRIASQGTTPEQS